VTSSRDPAEPDSPIESYLDELVAGLSTRQPRELRHLVVEAEAHLRDDAAAGMAAGLSGHAAELAALERFGAASELAVAERRRLVTPLWALARQFVLTAVVLGAVGAMAVGASGVLSAGIERVAGSRVVAAPSSGRLFAASDCARWLGLDPAAHSCRAAATADWVNEVVWYRLALGLLGALALTVFVVARRRSSRVRGWALLPPAISDTIAATLFCVGGVWTLGLGIDAIAVSSGDGSGQWLSAAVVALIAAGGFGIRLIRDLRPRAPQYQ
jgi:hypothetical protein